MPGGRRPGGPRDSARAPSRPLRAAAVAVAISCRTSMIFPQDGHQSSSSPPQCRTRCRWGWPKWLRGLSKRPTRRSPQGQGPKEAGAPEERLNAAEEVVWYESSSAEAAAFSDAAELIGDPREDRRASNASEILQALLALRSTKDPFKKEQVARQLTSGAEDLRRWEIIDAISSLERDAPTRLPRQDHPAVAR